MPKAKIRVFPDYCSSGLWRSDGCNVDAVDLGVSPALQLALKYWHGVWEFTIAESAWEDRPRVTKLYIKMWNQDGRHLVKLMNAESKKYHFVYCKS